MVMTWDTPGMASSRCLTVQSAAVRSSSAPVGSIPSVGSVHMPTTMIWPMIELIGAMNGLTPGGIRSWARASRSWTIWRAS